MIRTGLVSITFRDRGPAEIAALAQQAGLEGIEWGGDIHVPHGDLAAARLVRRLTIDAGLAAAAYGSYYRAGGKHDFTFEAVAETAAELGAPTIRVWAGARGSGEADAGYRRAIADDLARVAGIAAGAGLTISLEFHRNTLADTAASTLELLAAAGPPGLFTYWQPPVGLGADECLAGLGAVLPRLSHLHVFHWYPDSATRLLLGEGAEPWRRYLAAAAAAGGERFALLEFVRDNDPANLRADARTLGELAAEANRAP